MNVSLTLSQFSEKHILKLDHKLNAFGSITAIEISMLERIYMSYDSDMRKFQYLSDIWNDICMKKKIYIYTTLLIR